MKNSNRLGIFHFLIFGLPFFALWGCNLGEQEERYVLNVQLNDSLSIENGVFKIVDISIYDTNGTLIQAGLFRSGYSLKDSLKLKALPLKGKPPRTFEIRITAYKESGGYWVFTTRIENGVLGKTQAVNISGNQQQKPAPIRVSIILTGPKTISIGDSDRVLSATVEPPEAINEIVWSVSPSHVAEIVFGNKLRAVKPGKFLLTAKSKDDSTVLDTVNLTILGEAPVFSVTPDQAIGYGEDAIFEVSVIKVNGSVDEILADMDGDSIFEKAVSGVNRATFRVAISTVKTYQIAFKVKDTEGGESTITRKLTVNPPGVPIVQITSPSKDTLINNHSLTIRYTVIDTAEKINLSLDSTVLNLVEGENIIQVSRTNAGGEGKYQITVTLDTKPPGAPVLRTPTQNPTSNNRPIWKWNAIIDAAYYEVKFDSDTSKGMIDVGNSTQYQPFVGLQDGNQALYVRALDSAGNPSALGYQSITIKTSPPVMPVLVSAPVAMSSQRAPIWKWKSGDSTKGNGIFKVTLNGTEVSHSSLASFSGNGLNDGAYVLKVKELDGLGSESPELTFPEILVDGAKPVITVTGRNSGDLVSLTTTRLATVTGSILEMGGSGLASATWELSGGTTRAPSNIESPNSFSIHTGSMTNESATTLTIKATDGAKNEVTHSLVFNVNVPAPTIAFVNPTPPDGYVSNGPITAFYQIGNGPILDTVLNVAAPTSGETSTEIPLSITAQNEGGSTTITRTFYRTHAGVRFFTATGTTGGDCSSWTKACKFEGNLTGSTGKFFWLQSGLYDMSGKELPFNVGDIHIFGGIKSNGKNILDRSNETLIYSNNPSTGQSFLGNGAVLTNLTITGDYSWQVFKFDPGSLIQFFECRFTAITALGASSYHGTLMGGAETNQRFERCIFDNSKGSGPFMVSGKEDPYYNQFQDCTFIPGPDSKFTSDFENWSSDTTWMVYRFVNPTGTPRMGRTGVCGLPDSPICPP